MSKYQFLSTEWLEEARRIREEFKDQAPPVPVSVRMNQVITETPFSKAPLKAYLDTSSGVFDMAEGHLDQPDLTVTMAWSTAKALLVDGDTSAAMSAFMAGRIKVDGDVTKLIALQTSGLGGGTSPAAAEVLNRMQEMTA